MRRAAEEIDGLYAMHAPELRRYMLALTRNREEADDLVQEIFLRLCQQSEIPEHSKAWLSRTGYRLFVDEWRRKRRNARLLGEPAAVYAREPEQTILDREYERTVHGLLMRLRPPVRSAFCLRVYGHSSCREIARQLGCPENTVKTFLRRGRLQLAEWLRTGTGEDPGAV
ncbi:sigma-70 family RNA polymerase sigma factor [Cohnella sp. CFH 77786]|uniref:RNA polymerase sigma factor n=1 Tax=Cohnella sp. CFH 77786 TaxID=2662265 RepID=UPI001C6094DF|nr:RNA polymerase sigma factor [Cohnella sp. CFH 77786]MBW5446831.1 sigma-70 family RNA polymerase sigma factor [Cohnella sp. CFH 77786]